MKTLQLLCLTLLVVFAAACNRTDADRDTQRTAEQMKVTARKAGHQLADSWLTTKIQAQYFADDDIKARNINVSTRDAVVTLTGFVDNQAQRELAVQIAKTTDGVHQVNDQLTIGRGQQEKGAVATTGAPSTTAGVAATTTEPGAIANAPTPPAPANDPQIVARVQSKFFADDRVKGTQIAVESRNGVVTLSGRVADENERAQALLLARTTDGVSRVEDHLTVGTPAPAEQTVAPPTDDASLVTTIQAKYFMDPVVKTSTIEVSAKDGVVTLQGTAANEAARTQALAIVQNTPGVTQLIDRLRVQGR